MRSTSRRPRRSNRQSSTFSALAENSAKFVPRPSQVAPSGCGAPAASRTLALRDEKNCSQGRNNKADLGNHAFVQRVNCSAFPDIAAAIERGIGVESLPPASREWNVDPVVAVDLWREIEHHQAAVVCPASLAQPGEHAALGIVHDQPLEPAGIAIELVERRQAPIKAVEIADQTLNAGMLRPLEQVPIERMVMPPFVLLAELAAHEQEFLAGMAEHETIIGAQVREPLPFVARHAAEDRALAVDDLIMRERQDEIFGKCVVQPELDLAVMVLAVDRILGDVFEGVVHPSHVPLVTEPETTPIDRLRHHRPGG